jgi:RHS repeat-associated protein
VTEPSGAWTRYTYDEQGRVLTETRRHLNNTGTAAASHHLTTTTYGTLADQDGDSLPEALVTRIEKTLNIETARSYEIAFTATEAYNGLPTERTHFIRAATPGAAWDASGNLVTVSRTIASGAYADKSAASLSSDGSLTTYAYATDSGTGALTTTIDSGAANTGLTGVIAGTRSITVTDAFGRTIERTTIDIATATLLDSYVVTESDHTGRPLRIDYADGTFELRSYACCGLASETDRQGVTNNYDYDALGRLESTSRPGSTTRHTYDAAGNRLKTIRIGADDSEITVMENAYDTAGRIKSAKDALLRPTAYVFENLGVGGTWTVVTTPGGGTRIETTAADGTLLKVEGNATPWRAYAYAIHPDGSRSTTEYTPATSITDTTAWRRTTVDFLGRPVSETTADGATSTYHYDAVGRLIRTVDPDGVQTLYAYDAEGRRTVTALDVNRNGVIDYSGPDRISRTVATYATRSGVPVSRTTTETWEADGSDAPTLVSETDTTLDGRETWQTVRGLTTHALTTFTPDGDFSTVTTTPDGTLQEQDYIDGRLDSFVVSHPSLGVLGSASYSYDPHGRLASVTSPAGVTSYTYAQDGQVLTITTPDPDSTRSGPGYDPQVTAYRYDTAGRVDRVTGSDGAQTFTEYFPSGQVKKTWGARVYPQAYAYDAQRRVRTLTTWQDHAAQTGAAVTTWNYDTQTGRLLNKRDADGQGASYTYTLAGRLATRTWARTSSLPAPGSPLITTYGYTDAGDLGSVTYSDATPGVAHTHDRLGRAKTTTDAAGLLTRTYANGQLTNEVYTGTGLLSGQSLTRGFDALRRLQTLSVPSVYSVSYGYDDASRLSTITEGTRVATQGYHATQGYPETIAIANSSVPRLTATRALDNLGRVASVTAPSVASVAYDYNAANQRIRATREDASYWDYEYDTLGQVISAVKRHADTTPRPGHHFGYAFDDIGNRTETTFNNLASIYAPDLKNQYLSRTTPAAIPVLGTADPAALVRANGEDVANRSGAWFYHELTLDGSGEPEYFQFPVSATTLQGDPPTSELVSSETKNAFVPASPEQFAHDADGNLTQDGRWDYVWDAENRLVAMQTKLAIATAFPELKQRLEFAYDAQGRRIAKRVLIWNSSTSTFSLNSETAFLYDGWNLVAELDCSTLPAPGSLLRSYAWGLDLSGSTQGAGGVGGLLWANVAPGSSPLAPGSFAPTYDGNGNIIAWVDLTTGSKVAENDYTAFGELIAISGTNPVPFGFSTKYLDSETGLNYYGFRYYNPSTGRWPSRDPSGERGGLNLYGMVDNNLINFIDVLGLFKASPEEMAKIFEQGYKGSREAYLLTRDHPERIEYGGLICKSAATGDIYRTKPVAGLNQQQVEEKFGPDSGVGGSVNPYLSPCKPCDIVVGIYHSHPEGAYLSGYRGDINLADEKNIPMFAGTAPWGLTIDKTHFGMASYVPDGSFDINKEWDPEAGNGGRGKHEFYNPIPIEGPSPYLPDSKFVNQHSRLE